MSIESYPNPNGVLTSLIWRKTMSGSETSLSGYDNASQALSYTPGQEQVYLNGILLVRADDYTATNGTSITGLSALSASDFVQVNCYNNFSVASVPAASLTGTVTNSQLANSAITINGSAISLGGTVTLAGDIESVTATSPLTGGGSTGALTVGIQDASTAQKGSVQLSDSTSTTSSILAATPTAVKSAYDLANAAIPKTLTTTTGDILYASAANTPARLGIGTTGQVVTVASGIPSWATPASGGMTVIASGSIGSVASLVLSSIPSTYKNLQLNLMNYTTNTSTTLGMQINALGGQYSMVAQYWGGDSNQRGNSGLAYIQMGNGFYQNSAGDMVITFPNYSGTTTATRFGSFTAIQVGGSGAESPTMGTWGVQQSAVISSLTFTFVSTGNFTSGTYELIGIK